ncbi:MAG: hydrogenase maturation nickel metallochaperone HypA [Desulfobacterales bacterium]
MHEMSIAMQIVEIAVASIPADLKNAQVKRVNLKIGKLAAVVPESLRFCFQIAVQDTPLREADLNIEEIPLRVRCTDCNAEWTAHEPVFICRKCNSGSVEMLSGRELDITSIEVVDEAD